jgi:hypothetical protein
MEHLYGRSGPTKLEEIEPPETDRKGEKILEHHSG